MECQTDDNKRLGQLLKVPLNQEGFSGGPCKLNPVDFATEGVFLRGLAHGPKNMKEVLARPRRLQPEGLPLYQRIGWRPKEP